MKNIILVLILLFPYSCFAQSLLNEIDFNKIPQKKIRNLIACQQSENIADPEKLQPSYKFGQELKGFRKLKSVYRLKADAPIVWDNYISTSPAKSWNGRMVSFGLMISKPENKIMYGNDSYFAGIDTGQVLFINLRILKGLYNLAVALEIIDLDPVNKSITFSYLKGGKSSGKQTINFRSTRQGYTEIIHQTAYKSDSYIRDHYLYPHFHRIAIREFHKNMKNAILLINKQLTEINYISR